jgi:hypothetical protein
MTAVGEGLGRKQPPRPICDNVWNVFAFRHHYLSKGVPEEDLPKVFHIVGDTKTITDKIPVKMFRRLRGVQKIPKNA